MLTINSVGHITRPSCCSDPENLCKKCKARSDSIRKTLSDVQEEEDNLTRMRPPVHNYREWNAPANDRAQMTLNSHTDGDDFAVREGFLVANSESEDDTESMVPPTIDWKGSAAAFGKKKKKPKKSSDPHDLYERPTDNDNDSDDDEGDGVQNSRNQIITDNSENRDMVPPSFDWSKF